MKWQIASFGGKGRKYPGKKRKYWLPKKKILIWIKTEREQRNRQTWQKWKPFYIPQRLNMKCTDLRIEVDCSAAGTWVEIDAVEIVGVKTHLRK